MLRFITSWERLGRGNRLKEHSVWSYDSASSLRVGQGTAFLKIKCNWGVFFFPFNTRKYKFPPHVRGSTLQTFGTAFLVQGYLTERKFGKLPQPLKPKEFRDTKFSFLIQFLSFLFSNERKNFRRSEEKAHVFVIMRILVVGILCKCHSAVPWVTVCVESTPALSPTEKKCQQEMEAEELVFFLHGTY